MTNNPKSKEALGCVEVGAEDGTWKSRMTTFGFRIWEIRRRKKDMGISNGEFQLPNGKDGSWMKVVEGGCSWMKVKIFFGAGAMGSTGNLMEGRMGGIWKCLAGSDKGILEKMVGGGFLLDEGRGLGQVVCCQGPWNVDLQIPPGQECSNGSLLCIRRGHPGLIYFDCGVRNAGESFIPHFL